MTVRAWAVVCLLGALGCSDRRRDEDQDLAPFGAPCAGNDDCESGLCVVNAQPFCTRECPDDCSCPADMFCRPVGNGGSVCAPGENTCVEPDAGDPTPPDAGTPSEDAGIPVPDGGGGRGGAGAACESSDDCGNVTPAREYLADEPQECWTEDETGLPDGICTMADCEQNVRYDPCPEGTGCLYSNAGGVCLTVCEDSSDCRPGWTCRDDIDAAGPNHVALCWVSCARDRCAEDWACQEDGTCVVEPPGPLEDCTDWNSGWSCADLSPQMCSCSCFDWAQEGNAPQVSCELTQVGEVTCTCTTGGTAGQRETATVEFAAGGADCNLPEAVFDDDFCGLVR